VASVAAASDKGKSSAPLTSADLEKNIRHEILMYPKYTMWDDIGFRIENGNVELTGAVSQPYKKSDIERIVGHVPGVASVTNEIKVLPLSPQDDRLRLQIARAIFSDPVLSGYAMGAVPAIHIIVENGKVTLEGVVSTQADKDLANIRANGVSGIFSVVNNLRIEK